MRNPVKLFALLLLVLPGLSCNGPTTPPPPRTWGRLANAGFENQAVKSTLFFSGNWRNGVQFYDFNPTDNTGFFTVHPADPRHLGWSEDAAYRDHALNEMIDLGVNVVNMSYWGPPGTANWAASAPMQTSTASHDELFDAALGKHILIAPYIESYAPAGTDPGFSFRDCFPGTLDNPAPEFAELIYDLVDRYLVNPAHPAWPSRWARMYNKDGEERYVICVIHAASNQPRLSDAQFAAGFDRVADRVYADRGVRIGFTLDILPRDSNAPGLFKAAPDTTGPYLAQSASVLAVQCFIPEIHKGFADDVDRWLWKAEFAGGWSDSGLPFILDVCPGYDAHVVFPGSVVYGNNLNNGVWRDLQTLLTLDPGIDGLTYNSWNGYTEGMAAVPTLQYGTDNSDWARLLFSVVD